MSGIRTYLNNLAAVSDYLDGQGGQSNCGGPGYGPEYDTKYISVITGTKIYYNGAVSPLQIGVNNKNNMAINPDYGGYELTLCYNLNQATGKNIYVAKRDQGGTQLYNDPGTTSVTQVTMGVGSKSFTIAAGLTYDVGQNVMAKHDSGNYMIGVCSGYNNVTGAFSMNGVTIVGSGTYSSWTISLMTWNPAVRDQYCDQWLSYIYAVIDYCETNGINYKIFLFWIQGEEDGLVIAKANAYLVNLTALFNYMIPAIHSYIFAHYPNRVIPDIKVLIAEMGSNSGAGGDAIRAAEASFVAADPVNRKLMSSAGLTYYPDNVHITAAGFTLKGAGEGKTDVLGFWT